jgi:hypothetical protein
MDANNNHNGKSNDFPEAPTSWNTRYIDPNGFECQLTIRAENGTELLEKAGKAIAYLLSNACTPYTYYRNGSHQVERKAEENKLEEQKSNGNDNPAWCPIHKCEMKRWDKNGRVWYSHKTAEGWCRGR